MANDENRFSMLNTIGKARRYLQAHYDLGDPDHPSDKGCTIAHWTALCRKVPEWFPAPRLP